MLRKILIAFKLGNKVETTMRFGEQILVHPKNEIIIVLSKCDFTFLFTPCKVIALTLRGDGNKFYFTLRYRLEDREQKCCNNFR